jgi:predicted DNA-binding transcriptional regulator YafY
MKLDRLQQLHRLLKSHRLPVSLAKLAERMQCSEKTVRRTIEDLQNYFDAPIEYDAKCNGWCYSATDDSFDLPGMWLTATELQSLSLLLNLLENLGNGLLNEELVTVEKHIHKMLAARGINAEAFSRHIKVLPIGNRHTPGKIFQHVGAALLNRKQLTIHYVSYTQQNTSRTISPQTLVYYRENWYLDAWCHLRNDLRTFSLARIIKIETTESTAKNIEQADLLEHFSESYGIFSGKGKHLAKLRFLPHIAREIALQQWHPQQTGAWDGNDYLLSFPYSDDRELLGDILRHTPNVIVEAPAALKKKHQQRLKDGLAGYGLWEGF